MSFAAGLPAADADGWQAAIAHPFVVAAADGSLPSAAFDIWIQQDFLFVQGLRAVVKRLIGAAPEADREGLRSGLAALDPELELFRAWASERAVGLHAAPSDVCDRYLRFLRACAARGYADGLTAYYGCERAYLEAWRAVRERSGQGAPYAAWIENWTSAPFAAYVDFLGAALDAIAIGLGEADHARLTDVFTATVRYEVAFWDECWAAAMS